MSRLLFGIVLAIALGFFAHNLLNMSRSGPYPMHADEAFIADHAWGIVTNRDPNPHFFRYGSLPIYLTAVAQAVGAWGAQLVGPRETLSAYEPVSHPYYARPLVSFAPRVLFALLGVGVLCLLARLGYALKPSWEAALAPVALLLFNPLFQQHAWEYVNVDILSSALSVGALLYLCTRWDDAGVLKRVLVPASFCGAALATKYNAGLLLLPFALAIVLRRRDRHALLTLVALGAATLLVFFLCEPYALLDAGTFWDHVQLEMHHYQTGHRDNEGEPGLMQLRFHLRNFRRGYGWLGSCLILLGIGYSFRTQARRTLLLLSFPLASLGFMSLQRVNFPRNLLPAVVCLSAFAGLGLVPVYLLLQRVMNALAARWPRMRFDESARFRLVRLATALLALTILLSSKHARPRGTLALVDPDSRTEAAAWIVANAPAPRCDLVVPRQLKFNPIGVEERCTVHTLDMTDYPDVEAVARQIAALRLAPHTFFALPRWKENAAFLSELPERLALGAPLFSAGRIHMTLDERRIHGNPSIRIYARK